MTALVELLRARAWAARARVDESRSQLAALERELDVTKAKLARGGIPEEVVAELLAWADGATETRRLLPRQPDPSEGP